MNNAFLKLNTLSKSKSRVCVAATLLVACFSSAVNAAGEERNWSIDADIGSFYDSNVGKAKFLRDTVEDEVVQLNGRFQYRWESNKSLLSVSALAESEFYDTVDTLNSLTAGVEVAYSWQNSFGFLAPFYRASLTYKHKEFDSAGRTSDILSFQAFATRRISTDFTGRLGYQYTNVTAGNAVFDNSEHRLFANVDYLWSRELVAYLTASVISGDVYSVAQATFCNGLTADDIYPLISESKAIWRDDSFNQHFCGDWFAYRLAATTTSLALGVNYALSHKYSVDISATAIDSSASDWVEYQRMLVRASLLVRF
ncbi:hypothetical protein KO525_03835 [Psychrosphaera sp. B3R10]|uniref:hypothetical protein n=1 Tax=unclassified Psychrosphaera TaxID=2641570 RepID=UPI001C0A6617|nr:MULTISPECIES: hypothetical protein [unclassified Psychrosphaera]MBU2883048.1 hypothetical protein [Psychrosphaera sp. I2R16]MBU2988505.1 hypothetical protein [Psychrosphaera sp. B3R10]